MEHEKNGQMHVYTPTEKAYAERRGWTEVKKPVAKVEQPKAKPVQSLTTIELKEKYMEKFGKKPHWNMNRHNIEKALNGNS